MILLALETAYDICGAAIASAEGVMALEEDQAPRRHNERLAMQVNAALKSAGLSFGDLDAVAVSSGPGSYTGLRVGMSYAKGLSLGTGLPIIPAPTLAAIAWDQPVDIRWIVTWSHRDIYYAAPRTGAGIGDIGCLNGAELVSATVGEQCAGWVPEEQLADLGISISQACPSAEKVANFVLSKGLAPVADIEALVPDYFQNFQVKSK